MAFGNSSRPSRIYSYGAKAPDLEDAVIRQMRLANRYRNALVELERERRERSLNALRARFPDVLALEAEHQSLKDQLDEGRKAARQQNSLQRKKRLSKEESAALREMRARRREVYCQLRARKAEAWADPGLKADLVAVDEWLYGKKIPGKRTRGPSRTKEVRSEFTTQGLRAMGYQPAEDSMKQAKKGAPPKFRSFTGEGKLSVQTQGGLSIPALLACRDGRVRLEKVDAAKRHYLLWLRIGTDDREPIWAKVPLVLHRDLPDDAAIKWVSLLRHKAGTHWEWSVQFTLDRDDWPKPKDRGGVCGIDLGWRMVAGGLRVAYWVGDDEEDGSEPDDPDGDVIEELPRIMRVEDLKDGLPARGELVICDEDLARWHKADDLAAIRAEKFNKIKAELAAWLRTATVPDWLPEPVAHLHLWRSPARLAALLWRWHGVRYEKGRETPWQPPPGFDGIPGCGRFPGDEEIFPRLWAWRKKDKHLYDWECNNRRKAVAWRDDLYRCLALALASKYRTLVFEKTNWRDLQEVPEAEEDGAEVRTTNHRMAAVGRLRQFAKEKALDYQEADPKYTTVKCHACDWLQEKFDPARELEHICENKDCRAHWDQDENAARRLLAAASGEVMT